MHWILSKVVTILHPIQILHSILCVYICVCTCMCTLAPVGGPRLGLGAPGGGC